MGQLKGASARVCGGGTPARLAPPNPALPAPPQRCSATDTNATHPPLATSLRKLNACSPPNHPAPTTPSPPITTLPHHHHPTPPLTGRGRHRQRGGGRAPLPRRHGRHPPAAGAEGGLSYRGGRECGEGVCVGGGGAAWAPSGSCRCARGAGSRQRKGGAGEVATDRVRR